MAAWWRVGVPVLAAGAGAALLAPVPTDDLQPVARPAAGHGDAVERVRRSLAADPAFVNPACRSRLLDHGRRVERAALLLHGVTNSPAQWDRFARHLHACGYAVYAPRMPENGHLDRATDALKRLDAGRMRVFGDEALDVAVGLGERVTVVGISSGAVVAAWLAQCRAEVETAVLVAPALAVLRVPAWSQRFQANLLRLFPNLQTGDFMPFRGGPGTGYLGFSTRNLGEMVRLGLAVRRRAMTTPPAAARVVVVTNDADRAVSNATTAATARAWRARGADVATDSLPAAWDLPHDVIDPRQPRARPDLVYPRLRAYLDGDGSDG